MWKKPKPKQNKIKLDLQYISLKKTFGLYAPKTILTLRLGKHMVVYLGCSIRSLRHSLFYLFSFFFLFSFMYIRILHSCLSQHEAGIRVCHKVCQDSN